MNLSEIIKNGCDELEKWLKSNPRDVSIKPIVYNEICEISRKIAYSKTSLEAFKAVSCDDFLINVFCEMVGNSKINLQNIIFEVLTDRLSDFYDTNIDRIEIELDKALVKA